jgi:hypothetical protein
MDLIDTISGVVTSGSRRGSLLQLLFADGGGCRLLGSRGVRGTYGGTGGSTVSWMTEYSKVPFVLKVNSSSSSFVSSGVLYLQRLLVGLHRPLDGVSRGAIHPSDDV